MFPFKLPEASPRLSTHSESAMMMDVNRLSGGGEGSSDIHFDLDLVQQRRIEWRS
jgi:hypothetical protein